MGWIYLLIAILLETGATWCMRASEGFDKMLFVIPMVVFYAISFVFLNMTLKYLEISVAYAFWAGFGTFLVAMVGYFQFGDSMNAIKIISIFLIIAGLVGLKLGTQTPKKS